MKIFNFLIFFTLFGLNGYSQPSMDSSSTTSAAVQKLPRPSHLGFYNPTDKNVPRPVHLAAIQSVFMITVAYGKRIFLSDLIKEIKEESAKNAGQTDTDATTDLSKRATLNIFQYEIKTCGRVPPEKCEIFEETSDATAYVMDDGSLIHTAFHEVQPYVTWAMAQGHVRWTGETATVAIPVAITNANGKVIYFGLGTAVFSRQNLIQKTNDKDTVWSPYDTVTIHLQRKIGQPLRKSKISANIGDPVFIAGFPHATKDRTAMGAPDSDGKLRISIGQVITFQDAVIKCGEVNAIISKQESNFFESVLYSMDADGAPRLSGGAILNRDGEVLGTYTSANPADGTATFNHVSFGSNNMVTAGQAAKEQDRLEHLK